MRVSEETRACFILDKKIGIVLVRPTMQGSSGFTLIEERSKNMRALLREDLLSRCRKNSRYSLRSYSQFLKVEPSALSKILRGKRDISERMYLRIATRLGIATEQAETETFSQIALDSFNVISDWHHYALLELVQIPLSNKLDKWDARKMARTLNVPYSDIKSGLDRLERLGMLRKTAQGVYQTTQENRTCIDGIETSIAHRKLQTQLLEKAIEALAEIPQAERSQTAMTMAIDIRKIEEAKKLIGKFRRSMARFLQSGEKTEVYNLVISLYPLSQNRSEK
jgi:transcriptional regulator with XRE-family HTH domain